MIINPLNAVALCASSVISAVKKKLNRSVRWEIAEV
jgi:hypothetical protein